MLLNYKYSILLSKIIILFLFTSTIFTQNGRVDYMGQVKNYHVINGQDYIAGDDGNLLMYVNIWGHVKNPGTYLVYEGIDIMTLISLAGGPQSGANLSNIKLISSKNSEEKNINLNKYLNGSNNSSVVINPHDTIYVKEGFGSYVISKTNILPILLQLINLVYTVTNL